jgi:hypothetical protein
MMSPEWRIMTTPAIEVVPEFRAEQERALKPSDKFQECASCPEIVAVPAGKFMMCAEGNHREKPPHKVGISPGRYVQPPYFRGVGGVPSSPMENDSA